MSERGVQLSRARASRRAILSLLQRRLRLKPREPLELDDGYAIFAVTKG